MIASIETEGFKEELEKVKKISSTMDFLVKSELTQLGMAWQADCRENTGVITGDLKRSWKVKKAKKRFGEFSVSVGNKVEYAAHVEYGHRIVRNGTVVGSVRGQYIMNRAKDRAEAQMPKVIKRVGRRLKKELEK